MVISVLGMELPEEISLEYRCSGLMLKISLDIRRLDLDVSGESVGCTSSNRSCWPRETYQSYNA
jgi:hypothetical protein